MNYLSYTLACIIFFSCSPSSDQLNYPKTEKIPVVDTYFDEEVIDNYRWLEDDNSEETKEWVTEENKVTLSYLEKIPFRSQLKVRLETSVYIASDHQKRNWEKDLQYSCRGIKNTWL